MRSTALIFACLCLWLRIALAVPPSPVGLRLSWPHLVPSTVTNFTYFVWHQIPGDVWRDLASTSATEFTNRAPFPVGTLFGVTGLGQSNRIWSALDFGIAPWWPSAESTNLMLRIEERTNAITIEIYEGGGPWVKAAELTNGPAMLPMVRQQLLRAVKLPPLPGGSSP